MKRTVFLLLILLSVAPAKVFCQQQDVSTGIRPALIVIDIQNAFLPMIPQRDKEVGLYMINSYIDYFRSLGFPVIRVYHTDLQWGPNPDSLGFRFPESVHIKNTDAMVVKNYPNAFKKTSLDDILHGKNCNTLFLCGLSSVGCVLATYFGARDADYNVFMIKDAVMSHNTAYTENIQEILNALDWEAIDLMLKNAQK